MSEESVSQVSTVSDFLNRFLHNLVFATISEEMEKTSRRVFNEISSKQPVLILTRLLDLLPFHDRIENLSQYLIYLQFFNETTVLAANEHLKISTFLEDSLLNFLKASIMNTIKYCELSNPNQTITNQIFERRSLLNTTTTNLFKLLPNKTLESLITLIDPLTPLDPFLIQILIQVCTTQALVIFSKINDILSRVMPCFSSIKSEGTKIEYCGLITALCDTLILSLENQKACNLENVSQTMTTLFDIIYNQWYPVAREPKTRACCLNTLGFLANFLSDGKIKGMVETLTQSYIQAFKKETKNDFLKILEGFNKLLEKLYSVDRYSLETLVKSLVVSMHGLFMSPMFSSNIKFDPVILKYKNELLRAIHLLGKFNTDVIFDHFLGRLTCKEKLEKVCSMWILILLISRESRNISENLKKMLLSHLQNMVYESDFEIRFVICELTLTFIQSSCFKNPDDIQFLVFFLLKQVVIHDEEIKEKKNIKSEPFETTLEAVKARSQQILLILSNDFMTVQAFLWPYILEFIINATFSPGLAYLLKMISLMVKKCQENSQKYPEIDYLRYPNTPKPQAILLRLTILLYKPNIFPNLGKEIIQSLPWILPVLDSAFTKEKLAYLMGFTEIESFLKSSNNEEFSSQYFEKVDNVWLTLVTIKSNDKDWLSDLNEILLNSYKQYCNNPEFVGWLCKMNGILLSRTDRIEQVKYGLEKMFTLAHPEYSNNMLNVSGNIIEPSVILRNSVAEAFGYVSLNHFDVVLEKIRQIFNAEVVGRKQSSGLVSFFMKGASQDEGTVGIKITLVLALGYIAKHANPSTLYSKIEGSIINNILPFMDKPSNYQLKAACQKSILMVSKSLEKMYLNQDLKIDEEFKIFITKHREKLLDRSSNNYIAEKNNDLKLFSLNSLSSLLRLQPAYECEKYHWIFLEAIELLWDSKDKDGVKEAFGEVLEALLFHDRLYFAPKEGLDNGSMNTWETLIWVLMRVGQKLEGGSEKKILNFLMNFFEELAKNLEKKVKKMEFAGKADRKNGLKILLNLMSYSYYDIPEFRTVMLICVNTVVKVFVDGEAENIEFENTLNFNQAILKFIGDKLTIEEIFFMIDEIIDILKNKSWSVFQGLSGFLSVVLSNFDKILQNSYLKVVGNLLRLYETIETNKTEQTPDVKLEEISEIVKKLLATNLTEILEIFLDSKPQIPLHGCIANSLIKISRSKSYVLKAFNHLTDVLNNPEHLIAENIGAKVMNATLFIGTIMEQKDEIVVNLSKKYFPQIFSTFLIRISTAYDEKWAMKNKGSRVEDDPCKQTLWSLKKFLECAGDKYILGALESGINTKFLSDNYDEGIIELVLLFCKHSSMEDIKSVYDFLLPFLSKKLDSQKLVAIIFIAQFISSSITLKPGMVTIESLSGLFDWIHTLIDILLSNISDKSHWIRKHCFKGIGNISLLLKFSFKSLIITDSNVEAIPDEKFAFSLDIEKTQTILEGLFGGMEDTSELCAREALFSLQRLIQLLDSRMVSPNLLSLMMRLPDNFERSDPITRMGAFNLLGKMAGLITQENENYGRLIESLHFHLISLILHVNDENPAVKQACVNSLNNLASLLNLQNLKNLIETLTSGDLNKNQNYGTLFDKNEVFLLKTIEILAESFPGKLEKYIASLYGFCSSPDDNIKAIAGLLLCQCLVLDKQSSMNDNIIFKLCQLMEEKSQQVKAKMMKGLLLLSPLIKSSD